VIITTLLFYTQVKIPEANSWIERFENNKKLIEDIESLDISMARETLASQLSADLQSNRNLQAEYEKEYDARRAETEKLITEVDKKMDYWQSRKKEAEKTVIFSRFSIVFLGAILTILFFLERKNA
jgi:hypothetical protein